MLSVAHLFREGVGQITVTTGDGRTATASLIAVDTVYDLAVLSSDIQSGAVSIADGYPVKGSGVTTIGFAGSGSYRVVRGPCIGYVLTGQTGRAQTLEVAGGTRSGDSGGPMLNDAGQLVGIAWGSDGRRILGSYCGRIALFLSEQIKTPPAREAATEQVDPPLAPPSQNVGSPTSPVGPAVDSSELAEVKKLLQETHALITEANERSQENARLISEITNTPGPPGPDGPPGPPGEAGIQGPQGEAPTIDAITAAVIKRLPPIYVRHLDDVSGAESLVPVHLGEGFTIRNSIAK